MDSIRKQLLRDVKSLNRRLSARIHNIERTANANQFAVFRYKDTIEMYIPTLDKMSDKELKDIYKQLNYINTLKSSTVRGAKSSFGKQKMFDNILEQIKDKRTRHKMYSIYDKLFERNATLQQFKYEVIQLVADMLIQNKRSKNVDIVNRIEELYKDIYEGTLKNGQGKQKDRIRLELSSLLKHKF